MIRSTCPLSSKHWRMKKDAYPPRDGTLPMMKIRSAAMMTGRPPPTITAEDSSSEHHHFLPPSDREGAEPLLLRNPHTITAQILALRLLFLSLSPLPSEHTPNTRYKNTHLHTLAPGRSWYISTGCYKIPTHSKHTIEKSAHPSFTRGTFFHTSIFPTRR
jgi:hypothetical protein